MPRVRDTVLLSGWLFADLLLALAVLFLVANTGGIKLAPILPPTLIVNPTSLDANTNTTNCTGGTSAPRCTITIEDSTASQSDLTWSVSSDISDAITYSNKTGKLSPGQSTTITISAIPCQNGSFTFSGQQGVIPVIVSWKCTEPSLRLQTRPTNFTLTIHDINGLLNGSSQDQDIINQVLSQSVLHGQSVGLVIDYGGTHNDAGIGQAQAIAAKIYVILKKLSKQSDGVAFLKASYYVSPQGDNLYTLGLDPNKVIVDVYLFCQTTC